MVSVTVNKGPIDARMDLQDVTPAQWPLPSESGDIF
jgi:hypothetical protein